MAYEVAATQVALSYPGLMMECLDAKLSSKIQWKKIVKKAICDENEKSLLNTIKEKYKKLEYNTLSEENCNVKDYLKSLNLPDARLKFGIRSKMTRTVQMNYKGEPKFAQNKWKCQDCWTPDTQEHIIRCPSYQHLRIGKNLASDKDLVEYFRKVIQIRDKSEDEENK